MHRGILPETGQPFPGSGITPDQGAHGSGCGHWDCGCSNMLAACNLCACATGAAVTHPSPTHRLGTELCTFPSLLAAYQVDKRSVCMDRGLTASELPLLPLSCFASGGGKAATQIGPTEEGEYPSLRLE